MANFSVLHSLFLKIVMLSRRTRLIYITCARLITTGKMCQHALSVLTMCEMTSNAQPTSKIACHRLKGIMWIDVINVKNKQLSDQLKHLFSLSDLGLLD